MFPYSQAHLQAELSRLDLLLHREILRLKATYQLSLDEFRGLYISDAQVDQLVREIANGDATGQQFPPSIQGFGDEMLDAQSLTDRAEALRTEITQRLPDDFPWCRLLHTFGLSSVEADVLLLAITSHLNTKYETLFAYLNNDVTRKWPTHDLALRLFAPDERQEAPLRSALLPESTLYTTGLLHPVNKTTEGSGWLSMGFTADSSVAHHLLGLPSLDHQLQVFAKLRQPVQGWAELHLPEELESSLRSLPRLLKCPDPPLLFFVGHPGSGMETAAEALAATLKRPLLVVDLFAMLNSGGSMQQLSELLALHARLQSAVIYLSHSEALFSPDGQPLPGCHSFINRLISTTCALMLACTPEAAWRMLFPSGRSLAFYFVEPEYASRRELWSKYASRQNVSLSDSMLEALSSRFVLTPSQIWQTLRSARERSLLQAKPGETPDLETLLDAARHQSDQALGRLAMKVPLVHTWEDLVLPDVTQRQVEQVANAIQNHALVYTEWGFGERVASGRGLKVLFSGASGTGKTMTAGIIARHLGLDLYRIDLSGVVSKYIGETEKNLDLIFRAARASNAILFFDEADALFGKRSEVKDAHDRYANIEVAYLLQKVEEHEGAVILASNLSKNIDTAFSRRMHYVVEFPLPDESHREQLWRGMFPTQAPLGEDVDFTFLARQFPLAGGDIRNVVLDAAFLAAQDGRVVRMLHLVRALARQVLKQGKAPSPTEFKQYYELIYDGRG
jgi:SpoVK/Ycf46/Vps4 family AAA+-type ATPase